LGDKATTAKKKKTSKADVSLLSMLSHLVLEHLLDQSTDETATEDRRRPGRVGNGGGG